MLGMKYASFILNEKSIILQVNNYQQGGSVALPYRERKGMMQAACVPFA